MGRLGPHAVYASPGGVAPPGRKTRFRLLARLYRVGSTAHWVPPKGFFDASYIAFLLSQAYPGANARWSARLRANRLVELEVVESISDDTVRRVLKKATSSRGRRRAGACPR